MHIFQIRVARNSPTGPCVNGQGQEFVIAFVATDRGLRSDLEKLNRLGNFDQMAQAAKLAKVAVKFRPCDACFQFVPCVLVLGNHKMLNGQGQCLRRGGLGQQPGADQHIGIDNDVGRLMVH